MKTYYIFRHGLATHSTTGYGDAIVNAHILPEGKAAIERMAEYLKVIPTDYNVTSEFIRCKETADIITKYTGKTFVSDARLNEYSAEENYNHETFEAFRQRLLMFLLDMEQDQSKQTILVCTHGAAIAGLKHILTEGRFTTDVRFDFPLPGVLLIVKPDATIEEMDFNVEKR
ncbi:MAG: histidine phosphatase family protein [Patescibacteria group bacterium]|nr:histidine phosphatase family protein [Patescibacteria group bacterium]MDE2588711.1 histidine phosphatase family protein [Patescibacteria group bacterium]